MTAKARRAAAAAARLQPVVPGPRGSEDDVVLVPRGLADDMAGAITAMQALASEAMLEVAMSLKIAARRTRKGVVPPCERCGVDVSVGYSHTDSCTSVEARRLRSAAVPGVIAD